ncbi:type III-B CRISPR module RAMP protein Cmr1 [Hydrogenobaculum acidophilum]
MSVFLETKTYNFEVTTPIIMTGVDKNEAELRIPSIKGMLRWWFRFYMVGKVSNIEELKDIESEVFGSTKKACPFYLRIEQSLQKKQNAYLCMNDNRKNNHDNKSKDYSRIKRSAYEPEQNFKISFRFLSNFSYTKDLYDSILLLSLFGGIGARWRRGFGSVQLNYTDHKLSSGNENFDELSRTIKDKINNRHNKKINYFMNITNTKIYLIKKFWNSWEEAMNNLRDNFYRKLKRQLEIKKISYKPQEWDREVSPLIIQIKKTIDNKYFGIVLVYEECNIFQKLEKQIFNLGFGLEDIL